ncbi:MAG: DUF4167 domain-containing protein [Pseudomonadota bacterium]
MRSPQSKNRSRGRGNRKSNGNSANRVYESAGPEGKVRGTPQQIMDKYLSLARDAQTAGDRVTAENFLQHAEHYQRILILATGAQQDRRDQPSEHGQAENGAADAAPAENGHDQGGQNGRDEPREQAYDADAPQPEAVGGMTTIDAGDGAAPALLIGEDEAAASQPSKSRRNGRGRARAEDAPEVSEQPEA